MRYETALEAITAALAGSGEHTSRCGCYAIYRDVYQTDPTGRDLADYGGHLRREHTVPAQIVHSAREAADILTRISTTEASCGGWRHGRIEWYTEASGKRSSPIILVQTCTRMIGDFPACGFEASE